jgi:hypothetical protein
MHLTNEQNKQLYKAVQDKDPRSLLSKLQIPDAQQHEEKVATPLKRLKIPIKEEAPPEDQN